MKIIHRLCFTSTPEQQAELSALGIVVASSGFVCVEIDESDAAWQGLADWIRRRRPADLTTTVFSKEEIDSAAWLELVPDWHHGYPQPREDAFGYREATYDLSEWCQQCGVGMRQVAPFQLRAEPRWGRRSILQLNWVFDEYFVTPQAWESVFAPRGIGSRRALNTRGRPLETVVQLVIEEDVGVETEGLASRSCPSCKRLKYLPVTRAPFPALLTRPRGHLVRTAQYFGSGAGAFRPVLVSRDLARDLVAGALKGASFWPTRSPSTKL